MNQNRYKIKGEQSKRKNSLFTFVDKLLGQQALEEGLPVKLAPYILYIAGLVIFYIGNSHYAEKKIRRIDKLQAEVEDLRADFTTLKAEYMFASKQSEVAKRVKSLGLQESKNPPKKIALKKGEY